MPYKWIEPDLFIEAEGVAVYHCYDDAGDLCQYWYTTAPEDDNINWPTVDNGQFDVRELPGLGLNTHDADTHARIITQAIRNGLLHGEPAGREPPPVVRIEVIGGVAHVLAKPVGVAVEIIDHDLAEIDDGEGSDRWPA